MEPERQIEKLLRACAKKRQADGGDAFTLHPATRRRLQAEVEKQFAGPPEEESVSLWQLCRQQWAVLTAFALVIFFGASLLAPLLGKAKQKSVNAEALSQLKQIGAAAHIAAVDRDGRLPATLDELTNQRLLSEKVLNDPASGKRFVFAAGGKKLDLLASNTVLAYSPEDQNGRAVLLADGSAQMMNRKQFDGLTKSKFTPAAAPVEVASVRREIAAASRPAGKLSPSQPVPAAALDVAGETVAMSGKDQFALADKERAAAAPAKQLFRDEGRADSNQLGMNGNSQRFRNVAAKAAPVLVAFEFRPDGNRLAIVDADGSVYQGSLRLENQAWASQAANATPAADAQNQKAAAAQSGTVAAANNYFFQVAGQNRTLKQNVVFTGNLLSFEAAGLNSPAGGNLNQAGQANQAAGVSNLLFISNSRISGTLTMDGTNQVEVNAVPANP